MVAKKLQKQMLEYLVEGLRASGTGKVEPITRNDVWPGFEYKYIKINGGEGLVFLVDRKFTSGKFSNIFYETRGQQLNAAFVVLKDGKTFFRSAAQKNQFKRRYQLSLKDYSSEEIQRLMVLRPEEVELSGINHIVQYYQPESERLDEKIINGEFSPVQYDYDHLDSSNFKPSDTESTKRFIWRKKGSFQPPFKVQESSGLASFLVSAQ